MSQDGGPWRPKAPEPPPPAKPRALSWIWALLLIGVVAVTVLLFRAFPGTLRTPQDWMSLAWSVILIAFISSGLLVSRQVNWSQGLRHAAIWLAILGVLVLGFTYRVELEGVGQRVRSALSFSYPVATGPRELVITQSSDGSFMVMGRVNGQPVRFVVDTGASETVLSPADAERLGIDLATLEFDQASETANGIGYSARLTAQSLEIGAIGFDNMPVLVNQTAMSQSLLGMTFLRQLESFQVKGDRLYLRSKN